MCCTCGKHQYRWGWEKQFWAEETRKEIACGVLVAAWLAAQIIRLAAPLEPMSPDQAAWVREHVWRPIWLRNHNHIPSTTFACACQKPPSGECRRAQPGICREDGRDGHHATVIQRSEERRVGTECISTCRSRWAQLHQNKKNTTTISYIN